MFFGPERVALRHKLLCGLEAPKGSCASRTANALPSAGRASMLERPFCFAFEKPSGAQRGGVSAKGAMVALRAQRWAEPNARTSLGEGAVAHKETFYMVGLAKIFFLPSTNRGRRYKFNHVCWYPVPKIVCSTSTWTGPHNGAAPARLGAF